MIKMILTSVLAFSTSVAFAADREFNTAELNSFLVEGDGKFFGKYSISSKPAGFSVDPTDINFTFAMDGAKLVYNFARDNNGFNELDDGTCASKEITTPSGKKQKVKGTQDNPAFLQRTLILVTANGADRDVQFKGQILALPCANGKKGSTPKAIPVSSLKVSDSGEVKIQAVLGNYSNSTNQVVDLPPGTPGTTLLLGNYNMR